MSDVASEASDYEGPIATPLDFVLEGLSDEARESLKRLEGEHDEGDEMDGYEAVRDMIVMRDALLMLKAVELAHAFIGYETECLVATPTGSKGFEQDQLFTDGLKALAEDRSRYSFVNVAAYCWLVIRALAPGLSAYLNTTRAKRFLPRLEAFLSRRVAKPVNRFLSKRLGKQVESKSVNKDKLRAFLAEWIVLARTQCVNCFNRDCDRREKGSEPWEPQEV